MFNRIITYLIKRKTLKMTVSVCEMDHMQIEVAVDGTVATRCSCMMFERIGILCRHIVWILSANGKKTIPDDYVSTRWRKDALQFILSECDGEQTDSNSSADGKEVEMVKLWSEVHATIGLLRGMSVTEVVNLSSLIREFKEKFLPYKKDLTKQQEFEQILGCPASDEVTILPPKQSKNKGSGKRMVSAKAKAIDLACKPKRMCNNCKQMAHHDKRNCPNPFSEHPPSSPASEGEEEEEDEEEE
ncbi:uncharacterized protein LOC141638160 isoform X1 [Silene latifolia]|uniref:uncharacterized protein LOC141638160 isoform X1 n=1 Tax=Silene latifolia TaxID=37657 RepID=UPI003D76C730